MDMKIGGNARRLTHDPVLPARAALGKTAKNLGNRTWIGIGQVGQIAAPAGNEITEFLLGSRRVEQDGCLS